MQTKKLALLSTMLIGLGGAAFAQQAVDQTQNQPMTDEGQVQQAPGAETDATGTQPLPGAQTDAAGTQPLPGAQTGAAGTQQQHGAETDAAGTQQAPSAAGTQATQQQPGTEQPGFAGEPTGTLAEDDAEELRTDDTIARDTRGPSRSLTTAGEPYTGTVFGAMQADDVIGMRVVDVEGSRAGSVSDLLISADNEIDRAVIDVGGFLGFGARSVAVDIDDLTVNQEEEEIVLNLTRDQLDAMPEWSSDDEQGLTD